MTLPRGLTPIVAVTAAGNVRVSVAGLVCYRPGEPSRLIYRTMLHRGRKGPARGAQLDLDAVIHRWTRRDR